MLEEVTQDFKSLNSSLKKGLGKNGYALLIASGLVVALVLITKSKQQAQEDEYTVPTGVASYPDAGENADVIISSIGSSIDYAQDEIIDSIGETVKDTGDDIKDTMTGQHDEIKDLISNGNTSSGGSSDWGNSTIIDTVENSTETTHGTGLNHFGRGNITAPTVNPMYSDITTSNGTDYTTPKQATAMATEVATAIASFPFGGTATIANTTLANSTMQSVKNKATKSTTTGKSTATKATPKSSKSTTVKKPNYTGNSIVDGLKKAGVDSSYSARKELAAANGIKNYTGTASQNTKLLNSLKSGTLKTGSSSSSSKSSSSKSSSSKSSSSKSSSSKKKK